MEEVEIWKDIPGYEGLYQASNLGNIKSLGRKVIRKNGSIDTKSPKILKLSDNGKGYKSVVLSDDDSKVKSHYVHRLVAMTFLGYQDMSVDHIDQNRSNNKIENLRYLTSRENSSINKKNKSSKYTGVHLCKRINKWKVYIRIQGEKHYVGTFECEDEAGEAYKIALYNWNNFNITPKGNYLEPKDHKIFISENKTAHKKNEKIVFDTFTGIFYISLKEAYQSLCIPHDYKYLSSMVSGKRPNKTNLIYV